MNEQMRTATIARLYQIAAATLCGDYGRSACYALGKALAMRALAQDTKSLDLADSYEYRAMSEVDHALGIFKQARSHRSLTTFPQKDTRRMRVTGPGRREVV